MFFIIVLLSQVVVAAVAMTVFLSWLDVKVVSLVALFISFISREP